MIVSTANLPSQSELLGLLPYLKPEEVAEIDKLLRAKTKWELNPGPQIQAASTDAFETLYGGGRGGGKTELLAWIARKQQRRSLIIRRTFPALESTLIPRMLERYEGEQQYYNRSDHIWRFPDGKRIELSYLDSDRDVYKHQGAEYDFFGPDELTQFPREWYQYIFGSIRTTRPGQRQRIVATTNPGGEYELWVKQRWAAWLDDTHPNRAKSGEIRWFRSLPEAADYAEEEVAPDHPDVANGKAWSRTFIRALVGDNPHIGPEYRRIFSMVPRALRRQWEDGDWNIGSKDSAWQVIPTEWIRASFDRWRKQAASWLPHRDAPYSDDELAQARPPIAMTGYGLDVARGGIDWTVHVPEYVNWYAWPIKFPGTDTPDGLVIAGDVASMGVTHKHVLPDGVPVKVDIVGVGASPFDILRANGFNVVGLNGGEGSDGKDKSGMPFANKRAEWYWSLREDLDPNSGADLALPPHPETLGDLSAPRWKVVGGRIQIEPKEEIKKRIGRSTDVGDTIVYSHARAPQSKGAAVMDFYAAFAAKAKEAK